jgi:DNA repair exonuclease SbcCD ATPase subunit
MKKIIILLTVLSFVLYTCGPSVEGESKAWKKNTEKLEKLAKQYPAFATDINEQIAQAKEVYEQSKSAADEDKQAAKMREANDILNSGCVGHLKNTDGMIKSIQDKSEELRKVRRGLPETDIRYADIVIKDAESSITKMKEFLSSTVKDPTGAPCQELEDNYQILEIRLDDLKTAITNLKRKKSDLEAEKEAADTSKVEETAVKSSDKKVTKVECEYCGTMNLSDATECKSCGAPVK